MTTFNLEAAFGDLELETQLKSVLYYVKKGQTLALAMLPPMEFQGTPKLSISVESDFNGKKFQQHIVRFAMFDFTSGKVDYSKTQFVGIPLASTYITQLVKAFKDEFKVATQDFNLIELQKAEKTLITFKPKIVRMPDELWETGSKAPTWDELLQAHTSMRENIDKKKDGVKTEASTPWE